MTDKPILFSGPMVRALLDGRKTQTRRVLKPVWNAGVNRNFTGWRPERVGPRRWQIVCNCVGAIVETQYAVGDRLYVREAWRTDPCYDNLPPRDLPSGACILPMAGTGLTFPNALWGKFRQGMHQPRWASRITLTVTDVRVQRVQEISAADAIAEGIENDSDGWFDYLMPSTQCCVLAQDSFRTLWDSINAKRGFGWDKNPWVAAYTFDVLCSNIDETPEPAK